MGKKKSFKFYYGIPHAHTSFSTGKGLPYEAFNYAKNNGLDFLAVTDHNSLLINEVTIQNKINSKWSLSKYMTNKFKKKTDTFTPLLGFEAKTSSYGDFNIINPNYFFTGVLQNINLLILWMINNPNAIVTINHPHKEILSLEHNEYLNKIITSIEVGNGLFPTKYTRHDKYYYGLLDKGWILGAINGQDNHKLNFGDSENLTVCLSQELSTKYIIDAFRKRRTYSTESKTLKFYFTANDNLMGSVLSTSIEKIRFFIYCEDIKYKIKHIEIITNHNTVIKKITDINLNSIKYIYEHEVEPKQTWFVVRIYLEGNRIGISSPIFLI